LTSYVNSEKESILSLEEIEDELTERLEKIQSSFIFVGKAHDSEYVIFLFYAKESDLLEEKIDEDVMLNVEDFITQVEKDEAWYGFTNFLFDPDPKVYDHQKLLVEVMGSLDENTEAKSFLFKIYSTSKDKKDKFIMM
jgi:hypothetical protein